MLEKHKMDRINELARESKVRALSESEKAEQAVLRAEYLEKFRAGFRAQLEQIEIVDDVRVEMTEDVKIKTTDDNGMEIVDVICIEIKDNVRKN